jgi:glycosyltransferase involved in cell wall biosynthesis
MSFNETDKYSLFQKKHFAKMLESNFGADRFRQIYLNMSFSKKLYINLKAFISIKAIKRSKINFVLSKYAQYEKKTLFGIDAYVLCGAIKESIFEYQVTKNFSQYNKFRHKILTIARLDENKRIDKLLHAFKEYLLIEPKSIFLIGGRGPETNKLKNLVNILNISENVEFLGFISENELLDWYAMADIFVSIDWADYRITMYESLAMNTKVLLSNETDVDRFFLDAKYLYITQPDIKNTSKTLALSLNEQPNVTYKSLKCYLYEFTWHQYSVNIASILDK